MILKASQRGSAMELAKHLLKTTANEHVEVHDLRGFVADDLQGALRECEAIARGTRCRKHLFSLSLNPPEHEDVPVEAFEHAIAKIEKELGLEHQPRVIVFHEKEGFTSGFLIAALIAFTTSRNASSRSGHLSTGFPSFGAASSFPNGVSCQSQGLRITGMTPGPVAV